MPINMSTNTRSFRCALFFDIRSDKEGHFFALGKGILNKRKL